MKKNLFFLSYLLLSTGLAAQNKNSVFLELSFGRSLHGTGDTSGYHYGFTYGQSFSKKFYWQLGLEGTLNDVLDFPLFYQDDLGNRFDASLHTVTAGFQVVSGIKYNLVQSSNHEVGIALLPVFRYQATSLSDLYDTLFPPLTGLPIPVRNIVRISPGRTFTVGASLRLQYRYVFENNLSLGINGAFQSDTNGDTLPSYFITFGKRFL